IGDPVADASEALRLYDVAFAPMEDIRDMDAVILAVAHARFAGLTKQDIDRFFGPGHKVLLDIKGLFDRRMFEDAGYLYWRF
ncbi:MAG: nucleotide sugar dehydrogenase, partial [Lentisphaeria bacterium]|nr:nucleotide sugar dehydrogenase [Lentisphaeria bacterium]